MHAQSSLSTGAHTSQCLRANKITSPVFDKPKVKRVYNRRLMACVTNSFTGAHTSHVCKYLSSMYILLLPLYARSYCTSKKTRTACKQIHFPPFFWWSSNARNPPGKQPTPLPTLTSVIIDPPSSAAGEVCGYFQCWTNHHLKGVNWVGHFLMWESNKIEHCVWLLPMLFPSSFTSVLFMA